MACKIVFELLVVLNLFMVNIIQLRLKLSVAHLTFSYWCYSFIHSGHFYRASSSQLLLRGAPDYSADTVTEFHAEAHRQLFTSKGLAQGPYMAARAGGTNDPPVESHRINQCATTSHNVSVAFNNVASVVCFCLRSTCHLQTLGAEL